MVTRSPNRMGGIALLDRKLLRDLRGSWGQLLAIILVMATGVAMYIMTAGMLRSLDDTRAAYYDRYRFADVFAGVRRAPEGMTREIAASTDVASVESRIAVTALVESPGLGEPISGAILSLPAQGRPNVNDIHITRGRWISTDATDEIIIHDGFAEANRIAPGDRLIVNLNGARRALRIVGTALAPEYIYAIPPGDIVPDDRRFVVIWMSREALGRAYDLDGAFNQLLVRLSSGADPAETIRQLDLMLERYGATGAYARHDQISDRFVSNELDQLRTMGRILPAAFIAVAAFLLNIVMGRMIDRERGQIGLLKAFGYGNGEIALHYAKWALVEAVGASLLGSVMGLWLGRGLAALYQEFYRFPFLIFSAGIDLHLIGMLIALAAGLVGVAKAVARAARLEPAVAMLPPAPVAFTRSGGLAGAIGRRLDNPTRMIVRHVMRWPMRSVLGCIGIAAAMALLITATFSRDAINHMIDVNFSLQNRQDLSVVFVEPRTAKVLAELADIPGVLAVEPERSVRATFTLGAATRREAIIGVAEKADLSRVIDQREQAITVAPHGLTLSAGFAEAIGARIGDLIEVHVREGRQPRARLPVAMIAETYLGSPVYMDMAALNRLLEEGNIVSGAALMVDASAEGEIYRELKRRPMIAAVTSLAQSERNFRATMDRNLGSMIWINTAFASLIAIGVAYNSARISMAERGRDLASLRVLGFTRFEVSYILLGEIAVLTIVALPLGAALGYGLSWYVAHSFSSDLFKVGLVIESRTYGYAALAITLAAMVSALWVRRDIDRLDLVAMLKTRE